MSVIIAQRALFDTADKCGNLRGQQYCILWTSTRARPQNGGLVTDWIFAAHPCKGGSLKSIRFLAVVAADESGRRVLLAAVTPNGSWFGQS
jgi:hypothetical protein